MLVAAPPEASCSIKLFRYMDGVFYKFSAGLWNSELVSIFS